MNEGDFDKLFNDKFKDFEGSDFSPTEWGGLENRLNKRDNWRKILLWLLPLLLLSALAGGWFYTWYQLQQARKNVPNNSLIDNTRRHKDTLQDTIIRRTIIYQNDTIYRKILLIDQQYFPKPNPLSTLDNMTNDSLKAEKKHSDKIAHLNPRIAFKSDTATSIIAKNILPSNLKTDKSIEPTLLRNESGAPNMTNIKEKTPRDSDQKEKNELSNVKIPPLSISDKKDTDTIQKVAAVITEPEKKEEEPEDKTAEKELKPIIKRTLRLPSIYLGTVAAAHWVLAKDFSNSWERQIGVRAEVEVSNNFSFVTEVAFGKTKIKSETDKTLANGITVPEPLPSYKFEYWSIENLKIFEYMAAIQYKFNENRIFRPYMAVGVNGRTILPHEIEFEYKNSQNDTEKYERLNVLNSTTHINQIYGAGGIQWHPLSRWRFLVEGFVSYPTKNNPLVFREIGAKAGVTFNISVKKKK
jgi:hypothetical protein